jgi:ribosomal protein S18 acetylase RimI-like enzyme
MRRATHSGAIEQRRFGPGYREEVRLRDGRSARLTLLGPEHGPAVVRGFERLSEDSRYLRFLTPKPRLSPREVEYLTHLDGQDHFALGASVRTAEGWEGAAVARFVRVPGVPRCAELAITVVDDCQGLGLGGLLFERLIAAARERGYARLRAEVLHENRAMLALLRRHGRRLTGRSDGPVLQIHLDLEHDSVSLPPAA